MHGRALLKIMILRGTENQPGAVTTSPAHACLMTRRAAQEQCRPGGFHRRAPPAGTTLIAPVARLWRWPVTAL